ncbi:MAG: glycine cleavage system aminomethyltransferase GcvT [Candidatus Omnitrophota bacterium]
MELKKTPFYQKHIQNKGRIIDFAGWALPLEYKSMLVEAKTVRKACGIFDASHMGEITIKGRGALPFLQKLISNDISTINAGQMQYNLFLNQDGGIIDDLMVYHQGESFLCVVNASNKDKVLKWLKQNTQPEVEIIDKSSQLALISVQGPCSVKVVEGVLGRGEAELEYLSFIEKEAGGQAVLVSRSGYTGEDGFEIYLPWEEASQWWDKFMDQGQKFGLSPCGLGSRDILRIEAGYPLYGHELDEITNPYEASIGWAVKLNKDFIAKERLLKVKNQGLKRRRIGFIMQERAVPRQGYSLYSEGKVIGAVSSGTYSPNINKFIGMAYVENVYARVGGEISLAVRNKLYKAKIAKLPFTKTKTRGRVIAEEV